MKIEEKQSIALDNLALMNKYAVAGNKRGRGQGAAALGT